MASEITPAPIVAGSALGQPADGFTNGANGNGAYGLDDMVEGNGHGMNGNGINGGNGETPFQQHAPPPIDTGAGIGISPAVAPGAVDGPMSPSMKTPRSHHSHHSVATEDHEIDLKKTADSLKAWPGVKKGYLELAFFLIFFGLYLAVLTMQLRVDRTYGVDEAMRQKVVDEYGDLQENMNTQEDFFTYVSEVVRPEIFPDAWYNDDSLGTNDTQFVLGYNKLIGGLLLVQERGIETKPCLPPMYNGTNATSSYKDFYPICYDNTRIETMYTDEQRKAGEVGWRYLRSDTGDTAWPAPPTEPVDVNATRSDATLGNFWKSFTYNDTDGGFAAFFALADGAAANNQKLEALKTYRWLDKNTRRVYIKFAVYNGMLRMFTFVKIKLGWDQTGGWIPYGQVGGTIVQVKTINMEPYRGDPGEDNVQLGCEVALMVLIFYQCSSFIRMLIEVGVREGFRGKPEMQEDGTRKYVGGLKNLFMDKWTIIDLANYGLFILYIVVRIGLIKDILKEENVIQVPTNEWKPFLEYAADTISFQLLGNFFNVLLCLTKCFKYYRFQPRLAIINKTLETSFSDLYHFFLMFMTFLFGFAVMAHMRFGPQLTQFATLFESLNTCFMMMLGAGLDYAALAYVDGMLAAIFFICFMFLVQIILLNVLLAILVDSYALAKEMTVEMYGGDEDNMPSLASDFGTIIKHMFSFGAVSDDVLLRAVEELMEQERESATVHDIFDTIPEAVRTKSKITFASIFKNGSVHSVEEEEEAEEHDDDMLSPRAIHSPRARIEQGDKKLSVTSFTGGNMSKYVDPGEAELLRRIDEVVMENAQLRRRVEKEEKSGRLKAKAE